MLFPVLKTAFSACTAPNGSWYLRWCAGNYGCKEFHNDGPTTAKQLRGRYSSCV